MCSHTTNARATSTEVDLHIKDPHTGGADKKVSIKKLRFNDHISPEKEGRTSGVCVCVCVCACTHMCMHACTCVCLGCNIRECLCGHHVWLRGCLDERLPSVGGAGDHKPKGKRPLYTVRGWGITATTHVAHLETLYIWTCISLTLISNMHIIICTHTYICMYVHTHKRRKIPSTLAHGGASTLDSYTSESEHARVCVLSPPLPHTHMMKRGVSAPLDEVVGQKSDIANHTWKCSVNVQLSTLKWCVHVWVVGCVRTCGWVCLTLHALILEQHTLFQPKVFHRLLTCEVDLTRNSSTLQNLLWHTSYIHTFTADDSGTVATHAFHCIYYTYFV